MAKNEDVNELLQMDERDGDDALSMSTLKELRFRQELTFADTDVFGGVPRIYFQQKLTVRT